MKQDEVLKKVQEIEKMGDSLKESEFSEEQKAEL